VTESIADSVILLVEAEGDVRIVLRG